MLSDIFAVRYADRQLAYGHERAPANLVRLFRQSYSLIGEDLMMQLNVGERFCQQIHDRLGRELGKPMLGLETNVIERVLVRLIEPYDVWSDFQGSVDDYVKERLSIIEMAFRCVEEAQARKQKNQAWKKFVRATPGAQSDAAAVVIATAIDELNARFRQAGLPFHYHRGLIQFSTDDQLQEAVANPTWALVSDPVWGNVEHELQAARDHADNGRARDAARNAANALESTIKIISDTRGWTNGKERGAANYIDNLVSQRNGRFIDPWEATLLKKFFGEVRNDVGHGTGATPMTTLSAEQCDAIIDMVMTWIKALVRRY